MPLAAARVTRTLAVGSVPDRYLWRLGLRPSRWAGLVESMNAVLCPSLGKLFFQRREYDPAIEQIQKTLELDEKIFAAHQLLGNVYDRKGLYKEALASWRRAMILSEDEELAAILDRAYAQSGYDGAVRAVVEKRLDRFKEQTGRGEYVPAIYFVWSYARLGDREQTFAWLEKACEQHDLRALEVKLDPFFDNFRSDPRYTKLLRRLGLPP